MSIPPSALRLLALGFAALTVGCTPGERYQYTADNIAPPPERLPESVQWPDDLQAVCSETPVEGVLAREPYLQGTSTQSTKVLWRSESPVDAVDEAVRYWPAVEPELDAVAEAVGGEGWVPRQAQLVGLEARETYCYQVERDGVRIAGPHAFRTAPEASADTLDLIALGDSGTAWEEQYAVFDQMRRVPSELILHTGDVAYDNGTDEQFQETVFDVYAPLLRNVPMFPSLGNHDLETDDGAPYLRAFETPVPETETERYYAFDWGPVHFVALDSTDDLASQADWLDADLAATAQPWIVLFLHDPPYSSGRHGSQRDVREVIQPIAAEHQVALVLSGHDHHYERSIPIDGTVYVVTGGGGRQISDVDPQPHTAHADSVLHFVHLHFEGRRAWLYAIDARGTLFDSTVLETRR